MEYSPMLLFMLWALTPSDASGVAAHVEEVPTPGMTVHQESYFTFNHGKPFLAEQDPLTGAILNLKTTPVSQDDYLYEEEDEPDGIDRKDGPKVYTRNDIIQPSKDPDLHKFLNLPVHYSSSGKFPLISSSYANTKVQGHSANSAQSNHRLTPTSSTSTVSPSYYPLKTSPTTTRTTTTTSTTTTTTTTTTTPRPSTSPTSTTAPQPPPPAYEYEYEYDYDREPEPDKKTTTQKIFDFFEKDYEFLGASEEEKNSSKVDYIIPSAPNNHKEEKDKVMISENTNLFIPPDYLKPSTNENIKSNSTQQIDTVANHQETTSEVTKQETTTALAPTNVTIVKPQTDKPTIIDQIEEMFQLGTKTTSSSNNIETTTPKIEAIPTKPTEKPKVPFFPTLPTENYSNLHSVSNKPMENTYIKQQQTTTKTVDEITRPAESTTTTAPVVKPLEFHHPYLKPQDILIQQNRPSETIRPYNNYQRPYLVNSNVPPEMLPPQKAAESSYYQRPQERPSTDTFTYRPLVDSLYASNVKIQNNRPVEPLSHKPPMISEHHKPPTVSEHQKPPTVSDHHEIRPTESLHKQESTQNTQVRPMERPHDNLSRPDTKLPSTRPSMVAPPAIKQTDSVMLSQSRPYDVIPLRPEVQHSRPVDPALHKRPPELPHKQTSQRPLPVDMRYPTYTSIRPQETNSPQRPHVPEFRPPIPEEARPTEFNIALGSRIPEFNKNRPDPTTFNNNNNNKYQVQFTQPSKVENHFIKVSPGQENPSYSLQTSFSIGVPPPDEIKGQGSVTSTSVGQSPNKGVGQVLFPEDGEKRPQWTFQEEKRPNLSLNEGEKYPRPPWETHLKPPLVFNHMKKEPFPHKRPKPSRPDLPNILPQFRPNAKVGHVEPHVYMKTPLDTLQPPPLPRPQFLRADPPLPEDEMPVHRRNGQTTRVVPIQPIIQTPKRGSLRSEDEKTDPVFVVYPSNNAQDGVVVGTRGPQRPLPPDNLDIEDSFPLDTNKNFQARVDTPILKVKPTKPIIKNEFPYPLVKPTEIEEKVITTVTKEYTAFSPTVSPAEKDHDTEINVIPYLQDYMPFATKKPSQEPPIWNVGDDIKPISVTLKTQKTEESTTKIIDNHKSGDTPTPQDFQAPFHASLSAPSQGWSVVRPRPETEKEEETTTVKVVEEQEGKFDIQNFKPQLFGGFKPILPPIDETDENKPIKHEKEAK